MLPMESPGATQETVTKKLLCCICNRPAIYTAQFKGFCARHKVEAQQAMREVNRRQESRGWRSSRKFVLRDRF